MDCLPGGDLTRGKLWLRPLLLAKGGVKALSWKLRLLVENAFFRDILAQAAATAV